ncbi:MAG: hypothetical protein ACLQUY_15075 [Ktedonobacterales bacterium]
MYNPISRFHLLDSQLRHAYEINNRDLFDAIWDEFDSLADELNATTGIPEPPVGTTRCSECGVWLTAKETEFNSQCRYHQVRTTTTDDDWAAYAHDTAIGANHQEEDN